MRHVVVLDAGQMPDQPADGVGSGVDAMRQLVCGQPAHHRVHLLPYAIEGIEEQGGSAHEVTLDWQDIAD